MFWETRKIIGTILRQTMKNYLETGAAAAFSGPIKRGDLNTVRRHLKELKRVQGASDVYRALVKSALVDLPSKNRNELAILIKRPLQRRRKTKRKETVKEYMDRVMKGIF